ncbi:Glycerol-3-phosphate acyltransferase RAM2 [Linum grandiflorum]
MTTAAARFSTVDKCDSTGRESHTVVADLDGTLLVGRSSFPYFALVAFEAGGILRLLLLLLLSPLAGLLYYFVSEKAGIRVLIFATFAGMRVSEIESVARAVLPKFYTSDLHPESWRVFSTCGRRVVLTANPRIMVEPTLKEFLGVDLVLGTEISTYKGRATGFVKGAQGVLVGESKAHALVAAFGEFQPEIGLGDRHTDEPFMALCKEGYMVPPNPNIRPVTADKLPKPIVFHDGRLVQKPTPLIALLTILWIPIGFLLACLRIAAGALLPMPLVYYAFTALGVRVTIRGHPPPPPTSKNSSGVLFVCSHRTLLDPIFLSTALGRPTTAVVYSVSRLSELISPIKTVRLNRDRAADAAMIKSLLREGDLVICPEGTTCREPFLLRFSALFAELTDEIVPVAMVNRMGMFHGTTARGWKGMDPFYFFMNPSPAYEVTFLSKLPEELTCSRGGKSSVEVANYIQRVIAATLSYECTGFTRKDKYRALAGNDGIVVTAEKKKSSPSKVDDIKEKVMGC